MACLSNTQLPQPNQQNKTKQLGWCGLIIGNKKTTTTTTTLGVITIKAVLGILGS
jgi:hypothetical protein